MKLKRELLFDFSGVIVFPWPKEENEKNILDSLLKINNDPDYFKKERIQCTDYFHKFIDGNSSKRICNDIIKLVNINTPLKST